MGGMTDGVKCLSKEGEGGGGEVWYVEPLPFSPPPWFITGMPLDEDEVPGKPALSEWNFSHSLSLIEAMQACNLKQIV